MSATRVVLIQVLEEFDPGGWFEDPRINEWVERLRTVVKADVIETIRCELDGPDEDAQISRRVIRDVLRYAKGES